MKIPYKYHIVRVLVCARTRRLCIQMQTVTLSPTISFNYKVGPRCSPHARQYFPGIWSSRPRPFSISIQARSSETAQTCDVSPTSNPSAAGDGLWRAIITLTFMFSPWHSLGGDAYLFWHYHETSSRVWPAASNSSVEANASQDAAQRH